MTPSPDISTLIGRLSEATEGSRDLDNHVARLFGWRRVEPRFARTKRGGWIAPEEWMGEYADGRPITSQHGTTIHPDEPRTTTSVDAALKLIERVRPGWWWAVGHYGPHGRATANVSRDGKKHGNDVVAATPALAICLALLKSLSEHQVSSSQSLPDRAPKSAQPAQRYDGKE